MTSVVNRGQFLVLDYVFFKVQVDRFKLSLELKFFTKSRRKFNINHEHLLIKLSFVEPFFEIFPSGVSGVFEV